jgi:hypothetical protein
VAAADEADALGVFVKAIEHSEVAFARHTEDRADPLRDQRLDQRVACEAAHAAARRIIATRSPTSEAETTPSISDSAAPWKTPPAGPWSRMAPNTGAASAKPTSRPE